MELTANQWNDIKALTSLLLDRQQLAAYLGKQFDGDRDLYEILGYPTTLSIDHYMAKYTRQDIAGRVVDLPPVDTWRHPPIIEDGNGRTDSEEDETPFIAAMKWLIQKRRLWHYLQRVDRVAGIGRYGVLLIGTRGGTELNTPLVRGALSRSEDILYFATYSESVASVASLVSDAGNERYGLPQTYQIQIGNSSQLVDASRVIHVAEDLLEDDVYGMPRLQRVYNLTEDLLKITGGGAEATWKVMDRGLHADVRDGFTLEGQSPEDLSDEIDEYLHGLRRFIRTQGVDINELGSTVVDPSGLFGMIIGLIAASTDIPQRILIGSERGELASSQDQAAWAGAITARQTQFAEPVILRPVIDKLVDAGAVPAPEGGDYSIIWEPLYEMSDVERATVAQNYASAFSTMSPGAPELIVAFDEFREKVLKWPPTTGSTQRRILDEEDNTPPEPEPDGNDGE